MPSVRTAAQIRQEFLDFFREKGHTIVPSAPLVPQGDATLLFINSGMAPFKDVFLGEGTRPYTRVADTQKCLRVSGKHNDLDEVGHDTYHHTLFEMLGNWSFGDYFKAEAIAWAWELLTERWGLDPKRLYVTVHEGDAGLGLSPDNEAADLWRKQPGLQTRHILPGSTKDNFWMMGDTGPCGPCTEVHVDLRPDDERQHVDGAALVNTGDPRVIEIWNLVFIQYNA
ncbi:MAG TPA: alanine--tRNA ligase-related protein, partial [Rhodothermales bacterium]|nr:alanine--tRNA ligase-related protein [Rhodothermales bacterium]